MYGLCGISHNIQNIYKLSVPYINGSKIRIVDDLKPFYLEFLKQNYDHPPMNPASDPVMSDKSTMKALLGFFSESKINDLHQESMVGDFYDQETEHSKYEFARAQLRELKALNQELSELFKLAVHSIVISSSHQNQSGLGAHGGTSSKLIGLMWLTLKPEISAQDLQELYIHELTHTLVFLDELNYGHFNYENISKRDYWASSSILNRPRPLDKVIHSIVVATEVIHARQTFLRNEDTLLVHPETNLLKTNTLASIESVFNLKNLDQVCLPRTIQLAQMAREHLLNL
jgi:hypothetical protein